MITMQVKTEPSYPILITQGWENFSCKEWKGKKVCVVTDDVVAPLYLKDFSARLTGKEVFSFVIPAGERSKCAETYVKILSFLAQSGFTRKDTLVALGGGVVGDLTGFVAATYMRGIGYYQVPTSLLSMIDSSVGGKTAIDLPEGKNLVGAFYQPMGVYVNTDTLSTLPEREMDNGKGELIKYAFLSKVISKDRVLAGISSDLIADCLKIKADIVAEDEKEGGKRMLLNLGHTVGHAIESLSSFSMPHGLCVFKGLSAAIDISRRYYGFSQEAFQKMRFLLECAGLDVANPYSKEEIICKVAQDKKSENDGVNFVLIKEIGDCRIVKLSKKELEELL